MKKFLNIISIVLFYGVFSLNAETMSKPFTFSNNTPADAAQVNANFDAIVSFINQLVPSGTIFPFAGENIPAGFYECNGQEVLISENSELYNALGNIYGAGDGSTTFNLPDYRGMFLRGVDNGASNDPDAVQRADRGDGTGGDNVGTKQIDQFQGHGHTVRYKRAGSVNTGYDAFYGDGFRGYQNSGSISIDSFGGNGTPRYGSETRPKNISVRYIIKR